MLVVSQMCSAVVTIAKCFRQNFYRKPVDFLVNSLSLCDVGFVFNYFRCTVNRKSCIKDIIIGNVLRWVQFRELRRACDCTGAKVWVSQRLKSLQRIRVRNCGFSESDFFVVCEDIWIAICPFFVVVMEANGYELKCGKCSIQKACNLHPNVLHSCEAEQNLCYLSYFHICCNMFFVKGPWKKKNENEL